MPDFNARPKAVLPERIAIERTATSETELGGEQQRLPTINNRGTRFANAANVSCGGSRLQFGVETSRAGFANPDTIERSRKTIRETNNTG